MTNLVVNLYKDKVYVNKFFLIKRPKLCFYNNSVKADVYNNRCNVGRSNCCLAYDSLISEAVELTNKYQSFKLISTKAKSL